jgi:hypothetical protein
MCGSPQYKDKKKYSNSCKPFGSFLLLNFTVLSMLSVSFMIGKCSLKMFFMCVYVLKNIHLADFWKPILLFIAQLSAFLSSLPTQPLPSNRLAKLHTKLYKHFTFLICFGRAARTLLFRLIRHKKS